MDRSTTQASGTGLDGALEELLRLDGEDFVRAAYQCLLGRVPASGEIPSWIAWLREGGAAKVDVLSAIRRSEEGRARGVCIPGLASAGFASRARRIPIIGYLVRWLQQVLTRPDLGPRLTAQEAAFAAYRSDAFAQLETALQQTRQQFAAVEQRFANVEAAIAEQRDALQRAAHELETKADRASTEEAGARLRALAQFTSTLHGDLQRSGVLPLPAVDMYGRGRSFETFYAGFEDNFRGSYEQVRERLRYYLPMVIAVVSGAPARFVDVGTGRGEMVDLLREHGVDAYGVDNNEAMVARCHERGIPVVPADAIEHLASLAPDSVAGVSAIHVIEHLRFHTLVALFGFTFRALRPGGVAIFETPNPENLIVGACNFYYDPTHLRPLPPEPTRFLLQSIGFERVAIERLHPGTTPEELEQATEPVARLYSLMMLVPQDYALIAYKPILAATAT